MRIDLINLINNFCNTLKAIAGEMSEHRMLWVLKETDKDLAKLEENADGIKLKLIHQLMGEVKNLEKGIEKVGFGRYMEDYPKVITAYRHMIDERDAKYDEWQDHAIGGYEDYEPNPYDGTYSEE
tara:strand:+ start:5617 stop:5991 length:375 start_codon:yes stop_codon:yes gene_type:complete